MGENNLTSPRVIKSIMERHGLRFHKGLGQNFLIDANIAQKIVSAAELSPGDTVMEIGPGLGVLTTRLAERAGRVIAFEKDQGLLPVLEETVERDNVSIVHADVLQVDWEDARRRFGLDKFKVVANLPYYITSPILMTLLEQRLPITLIVIMVQKEVAQRIIAPPGGKNYGSLSVAVQYYTQPELAFEVPHTVFMPQPKVDSAVLRLRMREALPVRPWFPLLVKAAFSQRRKTLRNCLLNSGLIPIEPGCLDSILTSVGIDGCRRGETLGVAEFVKLADAVESLLGPNPDERG